MRDLTALVLMLVVLVLHAPADARPVGGGESELARAVDELFAEWSDQDSPGGAVVLIDGDEIALTACYGCADVEHGIPVSRDTRFELASVSKPFTAFAIMLLERDGLLSLDDRIEIHLPELPDYGSPITIADLLHHTSGLSDWVDVRPYAGEYGMANFNIEDLLMLVQRQRVLEFEPGSKWSYSNTNYALLAEIVARATGQSFGDWMETKVFGPIGMDNTLVPADGSCVIPDRAKGYFVNAGGTLVRYLSEDFSIPGPAHAFASIDDMGRWLNNLRTGDVGGDELVGRMMQPTTLSTGAESFYGVGLGVSEYRGVRTVGHSGQTGAFKSELLFCPDVEVGVVVLGNAGAMRADALARRVLDVYLADELEPLPQVVAAEEGEDDTSEAGVPQGTAEASEDGAEPFGMDPADYEPYLGGYRLEEDESVVFGIGREGDWLIGVIVGEGMDYFSPVGVHEFRNGLGNCRIQFIDEQGDEQSERLELTLRGDVMRAVRIPLDPGVAWLGDLPGRYYSDEIGALYDIVDHGRCLAVRYRRSPDRPLEPIGQDTLIGGIGVLTFLRNDEGVVTGFDFSEPEDFGERQIRFAKYLAAG